MNGKQGLCAQMLKNVSVLYAFVEGPRDFFQENRMYNSQPLRRIENIKFVTRKL